MRIAYGDLIGGISGDMFVAALLDLGLSFDVLSRELRKIPTLEFELDVAKKTIHSIAATQFQVTPPRNEALRSWKQIRQLMDTSELAQDVKETSLKIFHRLAEAEGEIHGVSADEVHFHEVGATDSIVDIVAAAVGFHELQIDAVHFSKVPLGRGLTHSGHGPLPVPGPATLELLKGIPVQWTALEGETVTPTGAAIMSLLGTYGATCTAPIGTEGRRRQDHRREGRHGAESGHVMASPPSSRRQMRQTRNSCHIRKQSPALPVDR
jgi:hypothetical protein